MTSRPDNYTIHANIANLTGLWKQASIPFNGCLEKEAFCYAEVPHSEWPNRIWFNEDLTEALLAEAARSIAGKATVFTLPYWDIYNSQSFQLPDTAGFQQRNMQIGMSLKLVRPFEQNIRLDYTRVTDDDTAGLWCNLFKQAFGYYIHEEILMRTYKEIEYYIARDESQPVGTAILYNTGNISGIHSVGVIPEMRRKGFADDMMAFILNRAIALKAEYATLQASAMGKGLYLKLGFKEEFVIRNYFFRV
ncbi:GNAT family N-acetyltransferase [uncultured Chitinophaga sp.]|jgi:N-acetylglutamate synthase and related acetyltransferases|uniref:GNAT family N-acetyltransferase n=1 Tax=uncultured Chitinophaga sp. TaxID=339340 RepID=UPI0026104B1F|nr:GNAT family N-acetyltransferase [uncultured Chitinophaga sp.]